MREKITFAHPNREESLRFARIALEKISSKTLTRFSIEDISLMPRKSCIYFFVGKNESILYVGKTENLKNRFSFRGHNHHKIEKAIESGLKYISVIFGSEEIVWASEQKLIEALAPPLNQQIEKWWAIEGDKPSKTFVGQKPDYVDHSAGIPDRIDWLEILGSQAYKRLCYEAHIYQLDLDEAMFEVFKEEMDAALFPIKEEAPTEVSWDDDED